MVDRVPQRRHELDNLHLLVALNHLRTAIFRPHLAVLLLPLVALTGCGGLTAEQPPVPDSTMVAVLSELHLRDARLARFDQLVPGVQDSIRLRYGVTQAEYESAVRFYAEHPEHFMTVYDSVAQRLRREADNLTAPPLNEEDRPARFSNGSPPDSLPPLNGSQ